MKRTSFLRIWCVLVVAMLFVTVFVACDKEKHEHEFGQWVATRQATCTEAGEAVRTCSCGATETKTLDPLGHDWGLWTRTTQPTCTTDGVKQRECKRCHQTETAPVEHDAAYHTFGDWETDVAPTCSDQGHKHRRCTSCGALETATINPLGHTYSDDFHVTIQPTCTSEGHEAKLCIRCGVASVKDGEWRVIPPLPHNYIFDEVVWDNTYRAYEHRHCQNCRRADSVELTTTSEQTADPTCSSFGVIVHSATASDGVVYHREEQIPMVASAHRFGNWAVVTDATCTETGQEARMCNLCGHVEYRLIQALGHDFGEWETTSEANCTLDGSEHRVCSRCNFEETKVIAAWGHDLGDWFIIEPPTCTEDGVDERGCRHEGCIYAEDRPHPALGHNYGDWEKTADPTCTADGSEHRFCARCNHEDVRAIDALGHDVVHHDAQEVTCLEIGWEAYDTCSRCDYTTYVEIPALGHDIVHHDAKAPTCLEIGWEAYDTCSRCDYTTYVELTALGHDIVHHDAQAPTCTEIGWEAYDTCSRCDYTTYQGDIPALGHNYGDWETTLAPTCTEAGSEHRICSRCSHEDVRVIEALGHDIVHHDAQAATCTGIGWEAYDTCSRCDYTTYQGDIPALGHDYDGGVECVRCGASAFVFEDDGEGNLTITGFLSDATEIVIPATYQEHPIIKIDDFAFDGNTNVTSVTMPDSITVVFMAAFRDCTNLQHVVFSENLQTIGSYAFAGCTSLEEINLPDSLMYLQDFCFHGCSSLTEITIPDSVGQIPTGAFYECSSVESLSIGKGVNYIHWNCPLTFESNLQSITVDPANTTYAGINNCLVELSSHKLILACAKSTIPADGSVTRIASNAFSDFTPDDTTLIVPAAVNFIEGMSFNYAGYETIIVKGPIENLMDYTFAHNESLKEVVLPNTITEIGSYVFEGCTNLERIIFTGTQDEWDAITKDQYWDYEAGSYTVYCNTEGMVYELDANTDTYTLTGPGTASSASVIVIPSTYEGKAVTVIGEDAFLSHPAVRIYIPEGILTLSYNALQGSKITRLDIPASVTDINYIMPTTAGCNDLEIITVDPNNTVFHSAGNCIINTSEHKLITACKTSVIPDDGSVTSIGINAFYTVKMASLVVPDSVDTLCEQAFQCSQIEYIELPSSINALSARDFAYCSDLESVTIPVSVTYFDYGVFQSSTKLKDIYYGGSKDDWNAINKKSGWDANFSGYTVHCTDGLIEVA